MGIIFDENHYRYWLILDEKLLKITLIIFDDRIVIWLKIIFDDSESLVKDYIYYH